MFEAISVRDVRICAGYVADVGEPLVTQEIVEDLNRRKASRAVLPIQEPHRGRLRRRLVRQRSASAGERGSAGKARGRDRKAGLEEMTSVLHVRVPLLREGGVPSDLRFWTPVICAQDSMQTIDITY